MKASAVISRLQHLITVYGDQDVYLDVGPNGVRAIDEIDVDVEDTGIIVWMAKDTQLEDLAWR